MLPLRSLFALLLLAYASPAFSKFTFPPAITTLHINIGPNISPIQPPPKSPHVAVLAIEANIGVANFLRENYQKRKYPGQFFVINAAIAGPPLASSFSTFNHYNAQGASSSLSKALKPKGITPDFANRTTYDPRGHYGPGISGIDFVAVLSLGNVLDAVPSNITVDFLKTDTQGYDLAVIRSAGKQLRRVKKIMSETYLKGIAEWRYENVKNDLDRDWMPYMRQSGFRLTNPPGNIGGEYDAIWERAGN